MPSNFDFSEACPSPRTKNPAVTPGTSLVTSLRDHCLKLVSDLTPRFAGSCVAPRCLTRPAGVTESRLALARSTAQGPALKIRPAPYVPHEMQLHRPAPWQCQHGSRSIPIEYAGRSRNFFMLPTAKRVRESEPPPSRRHSDGLHARSGAGPAAPKDPRRARRCNC